MRMLSAAAVVVLLTAPAYAQTPNINLIPELTSKSAEEKEADAIKEKAYKDSLRKIPDAKASSDPWGTVRSTDAPKAAAAPPRRARPAAAASKGSQAASRIRSPPAAIFGLSSSVWSYDMVFRPRDLASRMAGRRKPDDGYLRETFTLPRDKARARARDFLNRYPKAAYMSSVESWRELPDGAIEFTMRRLASAD